MKTKLLFLTLIVSSFGYAQTYNNTAGYYINELMASISGDDAPDEFIELRGPANGTLPAGTYFITIEGDGESGNLAEVQEALDLSGLSFGSNGYLTVTYDPDTGDAGVENSYSALLALSNSMDYDQTTVTGYDGNLLDYTATYMLINAPSNPDGVNIDSSPLDGEFDATGDHTSWNIYDSVSSMDDDGGAANTEYGWAQINVITNYTTTPSYFVIPSGSSVISCDNTSGGSSSNVYYIGRQGTSTGYDSVSDWMAGQTNSSSTRPNWTFSGSDEKNVPDALSGTSLLDSTIGGPNLDPVDDVLSISELSKAKIAIYPNPTNGYVNIKSKDVKVYSVEVYNLLGKSVLAQKEISDDRIDVSNLSKGVYLLKINSNEGTASKRLVVQ